MEYVGTYLEVQHQENGCACPRQIGSRHCRSRTQPDDCVAREDICFPLLDSDYVQPCSSMLPIEFNAELFNCYPASAAQVHRQMYHEESKATLTVYDSHVNEAQHLDSEVRFRYVQVKVVTGILTALHVLALWWISSVQPIVDRQLIEMQTILICS